MDDIYKFIEFLADSILNEDWDKEHDFYTEIICRKLVKLGYLKVIDGVYKKNEYLLN